MALLKKHSAPQVEELPTFASLEEAVDYFESQEAFDRQSYAAEEMVRFKGGAERLVEKLYSHDLHKDTAANIAAVLSNMDITQAPIEAVMELLKLNNAYIRNLGISILQNYGEAIKYYIVKFLIGEDRDLRIFAINVLGDVNFPQSRDMLVELLQKETDINVAMTAVDYMAEIGEVEDIPLLESLKARFNDDAYVTFAIDGAIRSIRG